MLQVGLCVYIFHHACVIHVVSGGNLTDSTVVTQLFIAARKHVKLSRHVGREEKISINNILLIFKHS